MLGFFARTIDDILPANPLVLFKRDQRAKLAKLYDRGGSSISEMVSRGATDYFSGRQYGSMAGQGLSARAARTRQIAAGVGGGLMAANYLDINPFGLTSLASNVATLGAHGIIGGSMLRGGTGLSKGLGMGYLGLAGLNTLRRGDNPGPL